MSATATPVLDATTAEVAKARADVAARASALAKAEDVPATDLEQSLARIRAERARLQEAERKLAAVEQEAAATFATRRQQAREQEIAEAVEAAMKEFTAPYKAAIRNLLKALKSVGKARADLDALKAKIQVATKGGFGHLREVAVRQGCWQQIEHATSVLENTTADYL